MNGIAKKILSVVLFLVCVGLVYLIYQGIMEPVNFNKEKARREAVAIQRTFAICRWPTRALPVVSCPPWTPFATSTKRVK